MFIRHLCIKVKVTYVTGKHRNVAAMNSIFHERGFVYGTSESCLIFSTLHTEVEIMLSSVAKRSNHVLLGPEFKLIKPL